MKRTQEQKQDSSGTTTEVNNKLQIQENSHLFNYVEKLAADHDVYVSNTMIKVTYKKALTDQNASDNAVDDRSEKVCTKNMNNSEMGRKKKTPIKNMDLCSSDISFIAKSPKIQREGKGTAYHSTPKLQALGSGKKNKYINGVSLMPKPNIEEKKNSPVKVQKGFSTQEDGSSSSKKSKMVVKPEVSETFLTNNVSLVKAKGSVIRKNSAEAKKLTLNKMSNNKKLVKLEKGVKKKKEVEKKGVKRKGSDMNLNVLTKKIKLSENKMKKVEGGEKFEVRYKLGDGKKPIMLVDPDLPTGWTRYIRTKNKGSANEQYVVYVVNPQGKKFRFKWKLRKYLEKTNSSLDVDRFFFGLYHRPKPSTCTLNNEDEKSTNDSEGKSSNGSETQGSSKQDEGSSSDTAKGSEEKELLLFDPDLPFGWKRVIHSNDSNGKKQVHIISPDGKIFRRRYRLNEYLTKHQYTHNLDRFYFGLYPKKEGNSSETSSKEGRGSASKADNFTKTNGNAMFSSELENYDNEFKDESNLDISESPMYDDPNLPKGWKRFIKIRSWGESAGRMEVVIVSPDGKRHRSKKHLEHYLLQNELAYKVEDFDFHVFGKKRPESAQESAHVPEPEGEPEAVAEPESVDLPFLIGKKKFTDKPVPELDISSLKEIKISPEGHMINEVNGMMLSCGLSSTRNVRRQRLPRGEHEKQLKSYLSSEDGVSCDGREIPTYWIQRLVKCRGDFRNLEPDAVSTVEEATKSFLKKMSFLAFSISKDSGGGTLRYEDVAELVHTTKSLSPLQTLIPKKITYKEYVKLNRPKQFLSFT